MSYYLVTNKKHTELQGYSLFLVEYEQNSEIIIANNIEQIFNEHPFRDDLLKIEKLPQRIVIYARKENNSLII